MKNIKTPDVEMVFEEIKQTVEVIPDSVPKEAEDTKMEELTEKSIGTDPKSEYLTMIQSQGVSANMAEVTDAKPREILELYETARYYGVVLDESSKF